MTTATAPAPLYILPAAEPLPDQLNFADPAGERLARPDPAPHGAPTTTPERPGDAGGNLLRLAHGRLTLDELVSGAWAALATGAPAACPVCDAPMRRPGPGAPAVCSGCATELS